MMRLRPLFEVPSPRLMTSAFSTLFASSPVLVCTTAAWRIFVVDCAPTPSAFPVVPDAEPCDVRVAAGGPRRHARRHVAARVRDAEADVDHERDLHDVDLAAVVSADEQRPVSTLLVAVTPVAFASPSETDDELLVPVVPVEVDAPPAMAPAIAPIEVLPPELPDALEPLQTFATLCCSAAFVGRARRGP